MKIILSKEEVDQILTELKGLAGIEKIDFLDFDFELAGALLEQGTAWKLLPESNESRTTSRPEKNINGQYHYEKDGKEIEIPNKFNAIVEYAFLSFPPVASISGLSLIEKIWEYIEKFMRWVFRTKQSFQQQVEEVLRNIDENYQELRDKMNSLREEYSGDPLFELLMLLPDMLVYLCRLLADQNVAKGYKAQLAVALFYLISPIDLIPEALIHHPIAFMDDAAVVLYVIKQGLGGKFISKEQVEKHWPGDTRLLDEIEGWYKAIEEALGGEFVERILSYFNRKTSTT